MTALLSIPGVKRQVSVFFLLALPFPLELMVLLVIAVAIRSRAPRPGCLPDPALAALVHA